MTTQSLVLGKALAEPQTLADERVINSLLTDSPESADTSEGNLMSLKLLRSIYKDAPDDYKNAISATMVEESKYLVQAMRLLQSDTVAARRLNTKFGRGLAGAVAIAKVLKTRADDEELHDMLAPAVSELVSTRKDGTRIKDPFPKKEGKVAEQS